MLQNGTNGLKNGFLYCGHANDPEALIKKASKENPKEFIFVRATSSTVLETARKAHELKLVKPVLVGEQKAIEKESNLIGWSLNDIDIIATKDEEDAISSSVKLFKSGNIAGFIKGNLHTDTFMGGLVRREAGIRVGRRLVHVFIMLPPNGGEPLLISDAALNIRPDINTRVEAALLMAEMSRKLGFAQPKVAILSATESILPAMPSSVEAAEIAELAREKDPDADFFGPLSFDLAISPRATSEKGISNHVAGKANALVVPDIVTGNVLFKSLVWCAGGLAAGLVLGGAVPIVLTSRSDPPEARLAAIALASLA
jgi:phosphate acetyltransferase